MKKQWGFLMGEEGRGGNHHPLSMDISIPSDIVSNFPLQTASLLRQILLADYNMEVQPGRLGSTEPLPNFFLIIFFTNNIIFIDIWQN